MSPWIIAVLLFLPFGLFGQLLVGAAKTDITPKEPIRLSGYGGRRIEATNVAQKLWAKALAIGEQGKEPVLLLTVDNCGVPASLVEEVHKAVAAKRKIPRENFVVTFTHTHSAPCLSGLLPNLFSEDVPASHQERINKYTQFLKEELVALSLTALQSLKPGKLEWAQGIARFAKNRRTENGPVDHTLGILRATDDAGKILAIVGNYACHSTTLGGEYNEVHGDWAGYAQEFIERDHAGAIGMVTIGCGADANPHPRGKLEHASNHGEEIAREIRRVRELTRLETLPNCKRAELDLPFDPLPSREQWEARAKQSGIVGYHAKRNLQKLDRGEKLPTSLPYSVQGWDFGGKLQMVFSPGEVVVDYALRLSRELDKERLWVTGYANDAPCYIPSRRILKEGGYEAESSLWYYDKPARLAPETEDLTIAAVHKLVGSTYKEVRAEFPPPKSPDEALRTLRVKGDFEISLAASEPEIVDPVAIDFGRDGRLWVVEMHDYPSGLDGKGKPGGRVKVLSDKDGDGRFEEAKVFLDRLPFPTGLLLWSNGVFICAAPDIIYAEDRNGDGRADYTNALFRGFATHNFQARVNSLVFGLDGWIYGACGLFGGEITTPNGKVTLNGMDFRFKPGSWIFEPISGKSQQGRVRDDFGNWFGSDNSTWLWHYPLGERSLSNLNVPVFPTRRVSVAAGANANRVYPTSRTLTRFNDAHMENRITSGCGIDIFRDLSFGTEYYGNAFACEPVHNLVHRLILKTNGVTYTGSRSSEDAHDEFLTSTDNWFRPVQAKLGPDGALWIVDMYRFVIEHPSWIPEERLKQLDVRAGSDKGRIYRIHKPGAAWPKVITQEQAAKALLRSNGVLRDQAQQTLARVEAIEHENPAVFSQILWMTKDPTLLKKAANHRDPRVRTQYIRISNDGIGLANDVDLRVRFEAALALGVDDRPEAGDALGKLLADSNPWIRAAVVNGSKLHGTALARAILEQKKQPDALLFSILDQFPANPAELLDLLIEERPLKPWQVKALVKFKILPADVVAELRTFRDGPAKSPEAILWLGKIGQSESEASEILLTTAQQTRLRAASVKRLSEFEDPAVARNILEKWPNLPANLRADLLRILITRKTWLPILLSAVQEGTVSRAEFPIELRQMVLQSKEPLAGQLFKRTSQDKTELVKTYASAATSGDKVIGEQLFQENCASCHRYAGQGFAIGPDISIYRNKAPEDLALAILDPNSAIEPRFVNYNVELTEGRSFAGLLGSETAEEVELLQSGGIKQKLLRKEILSMKASDFSMMPEGFEQILSREKFAHVFTYIKEGGPRPFGSASAQEAETARKKFASSAKATPFTLLSAAEQLPYPSWMGRLPLANCRQTSGKSSVRWKSRGVAVGEQTVFQFPIGVGFLSQPGAGFQLSANKHPLGDFNVVTESHRWESADGRHSFNYQVLENNREDSNGILEIALDSKQFSPGHEVIFEVVGKPSNSQRWFGLYLY